MHCQQPRLAPPTRPRPRPLPRALDVMLRGGTVLAAALCSQCSATPPASETATEEPTGVATQAVNGGAPFGTGCEQTFQNGWRAEAYSNWNRCAGFNREFNRIAYQHWYYNLHGAWNWWELPSGTLDSTMYTFFSTHGGAWTSPVVTAAYANWEQNRSSWNNQGREWINGVGYHFHNGMRPTGMAGMFTYACDTLADDGNVWNRWAFTFGGGGLKVVTGSYHEIWFSYYTDDIGSDFAGHIANRESFSAAWRNGLWDAYYKNDTASMATGAGSTIDDCWNRLTGITAYNINNYPQLPSGQFSWICWYYYHEG
jgi:hypothetical protein